MPSVEGEGCQGLWVKDAMVVGEGCHGSWVKDAMGAWVVGASGMLFLFWADRLMCGYILSEQIT